MLNPGRLERRSERGQAGEQMGMQRGWEQHGGEEGWFWRTRSLGLPEAGQAMHMPSGLTYKSRFSLSYGFDTMCKVEKNLRKTKVYECLKSPVAC
ncbi:hypothetical protein CRENBAI_024333 [Crenichthys baileyi]|uniref:Uncharacterized protein n=1 Tax=Crenichthys baileyi TaxID=28760 RepID=A0AAV9RX36_9TELE